MKFFGVIVLGGFMYFFHKIRTGYFGKTVFTIKNSVVKTNKIEVIRHLFWDQVQFSYENISIVFFSFKPVTIINGNGEFLYEHNP